MECLIAFLILLLIAAGDVFGVVFGRGGGSSRSNWNDGDD